MERSSFFNAILDIEGNPDRAYLSEDYARYFASFIGTGVFPNPSSNLQVVANNDMTITIKKGTAWINGYFYENTDDLILYIDPADGVLNRVDRIALRLDFLDREIRAVVKQGDFATNAVAKELQRDADAYELALADIAVNRGIISITQANITDLRLNKELCGIVHGVVDQVDTTAIFNQFESWYKQTKANYDADIATWTQEKKDDFDTWYTTNVNEFESRFNTWFNSNTTNWGNEFREWFDNIKGQLEGDIAANLTAQIIELQNTKAGKAELAVVEDNLALVEEDLGSHLAESASLTKEGHVQLSNSTTSTSTTLAATPSAVKIAKDKADSAFQSASDGKRLVANAITGKGVSTSTTATFSTMASNVGKIKVGDYSIGDTIKATDLKGGIPFPSFTRKAQLTPVINFYGQYDGDKTFVGSSNNSLQSVNLDTMKTNWTVPLVNNSASCVGADGYIYTVSNSYSTSNVYKYSMSGTLLKTITINEFGQIRDITVDKIGNIYVVHFSSNQLMSVLKYNSAGTQRAGQAYTNDSPEWIINDYENEFIYIRRGSNVEKIDYNLSKIWSVTGYTKCVVDRQENVYMSGWGSSEYVIKVDKNGKRGSNDLRSRTYPILALSPDQKSLYVHQGGGDYSTYLYEYDNNLSHLIEDHTSQIEQGGSMEPVLFSSIQGFVYILDRAVLMKYTSKGFVSDYKILG